MSILYSLSHSTWESEPNDAAVTALEEGKVVFFPQLAFQLQANELPLLSPELSNGKAKNISYNIYSNELKGTRANDDQIAMLKTMMHRFATDSTHLLNTLIPSYKPYLLMGRTSFRPVEIEGRPAPSYKKDDTRLHVDAFPANPNQGRRILRIFCNIHPQGKPRLWRVGEPFEDVAKNFLPKIPRQIPGSGMMLKALGLTKSYRSYYDHLMLNLHNRMKKCLTYQNQVAYAEIPFHAPSTWMVYTDQVSHAALSGQHLLEQTFYLPVSAMHNEHRSPLRILEKLTGQNSLI